MFQMKVMKEFKTSYQIKVSNDLRFLAHIMGGKTVIYKTESWEKVAELTKPKHPGSIQFSQNGDCLYIKSTNGTLYVYETSDFKPKSTKSPKLVEGDFGAVDESMVILDSVQTEGGVQLALINPENGKFELLTDYQAPGTLFYYNQSLPLEKSHLFTWSHINSQTDYREYKLLRVETAKSKPEIKLMDNPLNLVWNAALFDANHQVYILIMDFELTIVDSAFTKDVRKKQILDEDKRENFGYFCHIHQSNDGQWIIVAYSNGVIILRIEDLEPILVVNIPYACFAEFSQNDQYMLVGTWSKGYLLENNLNK
ncbi:hypothetical protein [Bacillus sp. FJAT-27245]|uniref:hypothetical protein n=1 Tax=Bacillus sp. FJAT-27245 TaxID=1684144 RepID=UPI0006A76BA7|nr:hypothetical protein [Bacillus sp. FJAT-27245]